MIENNTDNQYKIIIKATSIFGIMQIMKMIISVIGSKFVAIFLGPVGIGTVGLLTNTLNIILSISSFGIATTSVREIAVAQADDNPDKLPETIAIHQKIVLFTGLLAAIITILLSKFLSQWTFGKSNYQSWFLVLSINFVIIGLATIRASILQGKQLLRAIAISNIVSSFLITICTIILYYFLKFEGIVWVILSSSLITLFVNYYFTRNFKSKAVNKTFLEFVSKAKPIMQLGFLLSINSIFGLVCTYIIKFYLNNNGASAQILGFYEVSTVILISYVGMIFNAMAVDFYPRLTIVNQDNTKIIELVNNQLEIALLLITPAIIALYLLAPIVVKLLYTTDFLPTVFILKAALLAIIIKAIVWPLGFIILAKGDKKQYFKQELVSDFLNVSLTIWFYRLFGLTGIGFAMLVNYIVYGIYVYVTVNRAYGFSYRNDCLKIILFSSIVGICACATVLLCGSDFVTIILVFLLLVSIIFSYKGLDKRIGLGSFIIYVKKKIFR